MFARLLVVLVVAAVTLAAGSAPAAAQPGSGDDAASSRVESTPREPRADFGDRCRPGVPLIDEVAEGVCDVVKDELDDVTGVVGKIGGSVAGGAMNQLSRWMTNSATWVTGQIAKAIQATTTPELDAGWYRERYASMAGLGLGLALLVAMLAVASAALRRDPDALAATFLGMFRAGLGTGLVLALTVIALGVADSVSNAVASDAVGRNASGFWRDVGKMWGRDDFAGLPGAVAFLLALVQVVAALGVWIELLLRQAAIYVAVLFMPAALAASIWPALRAWQSRLTRLLVVVVLLKPILVTVLALAGSAAASALTGQTRGPVGVLLTSVVIFALAACMPWALMYLIAVDHEAVWTARGGIDGARSSVSRARSGLGGGLRPSGQGAGVARAGGSTKAGASEGIAGRGPRSGASGGASAHRGGGLGASATAGGTATAGHGAGLISAAGAVAAAAGMSAQAGRTTAQRADKSASAVAAASPGDSARPPGAERPSSGSRAGAAARAAASTGAGGPQGSRGAGGTPPSSAASGGGTRSAGGRTAAPPARGGDRESSGGTSSGQGSGGPAKAPVRRPGSQRGDGSRNS